MVWRCVFRTTRVAVIVTALMINQTFGFGFGWRCRPACPPSPACAPAPPCGASIAPMAVESYGPDFAPCCETATPCGSAVSSCGSTVTPCGSDVISSSPVLTESAGCCGAGESIPMGAPMTSDVLPMESTPHDDGSSVLYPSEPMPNDAEEMAADAGDPMPMDEPLMGGTFSDSDPPTPMPETEPEPANDDSSSFFDPDLSADPDAGTGEVPPDADDNAFEAFSESETPPAPDMTSPDATAPNDLEGFGDPPPANDDPGDIFDGLGSNAKPRRFVSVRQHQLSQRYWSDVTGQFHTLAQLVDLGKGEIRLLKNNGRFSTVDMSQLSRVDRAYVLAVASDTSRFAAPAAANMLAAQK